VPRVRYAPRGWWPSMLRLLRLPRRSALGARARCGLRSPFCTSAACFRFVLRLKIDRRLGDRLFLTHQAVLTLCDMTGIPLTLRYVRPDLIATRRKNSRQIFIAPQTHARTAL